MQVRRHWQDDRVLVAALLWLGFAAIALAADDVTALFATLRANAGLSGNIVASLNAQDRLAELVKQDPGTVVPAIAAELKAASAGDRKTASYAIALISVLEKAGPAAEAAVPALTEIAQDEKQRNDFVLLKTQMALAAIGTPQARDASQAAGKKSVERWERSASAEDVRQAVAQHSYLIRRELRSAHLGEEVVQASVTALSAIGTKAAPALPDLLRAWGDPRIGTSLRAEIAAEIRAAGVENVEAAALDRARQEPRSGPLDEIIADVRSDEPLVSTLAMTELGQRGPSKQAIDALIDALAKKRNPGQAALVLGRFGAPAERAVPFLLPYVTDRNAGPNVIQAVGLLGAGNEEVARALRGVLADQSSPHRAMAAAALGSLQATASLPELRQALASSDKYTRILSAKALGALGAQAAAAVADLTTMLDDRDLDIRTNAVEALGAIGAAASSAVPKIEQQLQLPAGRLKGAAVSALEQIGGEQATAALARDARRHADADRREYQQMRQSGNAEALVRFARDLPKARRVAVGREMLKDRDATIAQAGAALLIEAGATPPAAKEPPDR